MTRGRTCYFCQAERDSATGRCRTCGSLPPRGRQREGALSGTLQLLLALLMVGSSLGYLTMGTAEQQARARGALAGSVVVAAIGVGLMWVWPWPSGGQVDAWGSGVRRRRFGGQRGDGA